MCYHAVNYSEGEMMMASTSWEWVSVASGDVRLLVRFSAQACHGVRADIQL